MEMKEKLGLRHLVGESPSFLAAVEKIPLVARCEASVLLFGETGTGKELVARAIHYLSPRAKKPFIAVNCGAIPTELVENELFGHERSAYTGAVTPQTGVVQEAEGGTLLLDEVDSLPLLAQVKLLRFLQEKEFRPLGSSRTRRADVRVLAAANTDPDTAVREGRMRQDLYYRLSVIPLHLPPLRERREDIPHLARHFLRKHAGERRRPPVLSPGALEALVGYDWPGNVRELEHVLERAVVLAPDEELMEERHIGLPCAPGRAAAVPAAEGFREAKARAVAEFEESYLRKLLLVHGGNISGAARAAGKNRRAFWELIRKHGIDPRSFRGSTPTTT
jgi:two-component system, NtrC family, response regulator GlrR